MSANLFPQLTGHPEWYAIGASPANVAKSAYGHNWNLTVSADQNGGIVLNGFSGDKHEGSDFVILSDTEFEDSNFKLSPGTYYFYVDDETLLETVQLRVCRGYLDITRTNYNSGETFTIPEEYSNVSFYCAVWVKLNAEFENYTFHPQLVRFTDNGSQPSNENETQTTDENNSGENTESGDDSTEIRQLEVSELFTGVGTRAFDAGYFGAGRIFWRVRDYSSEGAQGEWSETSSFFVYGISEAKNVACDNKPFATITWEATGQTSYWIKVDNGLDYGPYYGTATSYTLPEPLRDGPHTLSIQIQNKLGLSSPWTEIHTEIANDPSPNETGTFPLLIAADVDAELQWSPVDLSNTVEYLVYRDQKLIATLNKNELSYSDKTVLGQHSYEIVQHLESGDYILYSHPDVFLSTEITKIALYEGGSWIDLQLTDDRYPKNTFRRRRLTEKNRIMGSKYPVLEFTDFEELSGEYEVCWPYTERSSVRQFQKLFGQMVILKSRGEQVIIGVLDELNTEISSQLIKCSFSIEQSVISEDIGSMPFGEDDLVPLRVSAGGVYLPGEYGARGFSLVDADVHGGDSLDKIYFGEMTGEQLGVRTTNPGLTNPKWYEDIAEAINEAYSRSEDDETDLQGT